MNTTQPVRVRFAPSPTGYLHVGSLRTALYNYLFARKHGGTYLLRIEDTDQSRFVEGSLESLVRSLAFMGINADEGVVLTGDEVAESGDRGPYQQSKRLSFYREYVDQLLESGHAYYCFCTPERLDEVRKEMAAKKLPPKYDKHCLHLDPSEVEQRIQSGEAYVVRFNIAPGEDVVFTDLVRGEVKFNTRDVDDQVLLKSDGFPTYHLAVVVDDHLMGITHVFRSEEWLPSTPKHILLYRAFGWEVPFIGHVSVILGPDGKKKLSKRDGGTAVHDFLQEGYLKEALLNFFVLLGWNPGNGSTQEIFSLEELEKIFDIGGLHKAGAVLDRKKLDWMNSEYIKKLSLDELYTRIKEGGWFEKELIVSAPEVMKTEEYLKKVLSVEQERLSRLALVGDENPFFFQAEVQHDKDMLPWKGNDEETTKASLLDALELLEALDDAQWQDQKYMEAVFFAKAGDKKGDLLWPLRVALTGAKRSPSPFEVLFVLGKDIALTRLKKAISLF